MAWYEPGKAHSTSLKTQIYLAAWYTPFMRMRYPSSSSSAPVAAPPILALQLATSWGIAPAAMILACTCKHDNIGPLIIETQQTQNPNSGKAIISKPSIPETKLWSPQLGQNLEHRTLYQNKACKASKQMMRPCECGNRVCRRTGMSCTFMKGVAYKA